MSDALFTRTQQRVLGPLFGNPDRSFYGNELVRLANVGIGAVQRELGRLVSAGLVNVSRIGNQKHYRANTAAPIFAELRHIVLRTFGLADPLRNALAPLAERIQLAFIYGSVAKGEDTAGSDIDLMVVADQIAYPELFDALEGAREILQRPINPTLLGSKEWLKKVTEQGGFLQRVLAQPRIPLVGTVDDVPQSGKSGQGESTQA